jgi:serine/threonine protein kinase
MQKIQNSLEIPQFDTYLDCFVDNSNSYYLIMNPIGKSFKEINELNPEHRNQFLLIDRIKLYLQIFLDLYYMHSNKISHCDITMENIVFGKNSLKTARLVGFGRISKNIPCENVPDELKAPELFFPNKINISQDLFVQADIWTLGLSILKFEEALAFSQNSEDPHLYTDAKRDQTLIEKIKTDSEDFYKNNDNNKEEVNTNAYALIFRSLMLRMNKEEEFKSSNQFYFTNEEANDNLLEFIKLITSMMTMDVRTRPTIVDLIIRMWSIYSKVTKDITHVYKQGNMKFFKEEDIFQKILSFREKSQAKIFI